MRPMGVLRAPALARLAGVGFAFGPAVDAIHNQALLAYDLFPVSVFDAKTSLLIPPLLAVTYALLGGLLPALASKVVVGGGGPVGEPLLQFPMLSCSEDRRARAAVAVGATCAVIKLSAVLATAGGVPSDAALAALAGAALFEWLLLDATWASLLAGLVVAIAGPLAEVPFIALGAWHYLPDAADNYAPLAPLGLDVAISSLTAPCYFAVTTDAIALGRWFDRDFDDDRHDDDDDDSRRV